MRTIEWKDGVVVIIDQTKLPKETDWIKIENYREMASAIKDMKLRGAPLIGVAAAYGLALTAYHSIAKTREDLIKDLEKTAEVLRNTRPTAVNLFWAIDRVMKKAKQSNGTRNALAQAIISEAETMADEDVESNKRMGKHGASLIEDGDVILAPLMPK